MAFERARFPQLRDKFRPSTGVKHRVDVGQVAAQQFLLGTVKQRQRCAVAIHDPPSSGRAQKTAMPSASMPRRISVNSFASAIFSRYCN